MISCEAAVIGGGPAGLTAALYLVRAGMDTVLLEKGAMGGQVLSTAEVENYPGLPKGVKGWELADLFAEHIEGTAVRKKRGDVVSLHFDAAERRYVLQLAEGESLVARVVLVCSGARYRNLGVDQEDAYTGHGLSYCAVCDGNFFRGQDVVVVGGGNAALEESLYLSRIVNKIYLVHRRDAFRGARVYLDKVLALPEKIELVTSSVVQELRGKPSLEGVLVKNLVSGAERLLPVQGIFVFVGKEPSGDFYPPELKRDQQGFIITDTEMRTNLPGLFAAGDIRSKLCRQVSSAVGDGATAATAAISYLEQNYA